MIITKLTELKLRLFAIGLSLVLGIIISIIAIWFFLISQFFANLWSSDLPSTFSIAMADYSALVAGSLLISALLAGQILRLIEGKRPQGPADLILAAQTDSQPNVKAGLQSSLLALVSVSGGASVGIFGPLVLLGGCLSSQLGRWRNLLPGDVALGVGAGAAIAAVFAAPIGAAVFAHEAIIRRFGNLGAGPVLAGTFAAYWTANLILGEHRLFLIQTIPILNTATLINALLIGIACGLISSLYMSIMVKTARAANASGIPIALRPLIPAAILFGISPFLPHLLGTGTTTIDMALVGTLSLGLMVALLIGKVLMTSFCVGFGFFGGVFGPALFIGAMVGGCFDILLSGGEPITTSYAALGACCCIAAIIGAPIAAVLITFELTGSYEWAVLSMIGVVTCTQISRSLVGRSLFDRQLQLRGVEVHDDRRIAS